MDPAGWHRCPFASDSKQPAWQRKGRAAGSPLRGISASTCTMLAPFSCPFSPVFRAPPGQKPPPLRFWDPRSAFGTLESPKNAFGTDAWPADPALNIIERPGRDWLKL